MSISSMKGALARAAGHAASVTQVEALSPRVIRVWVEGAALRRARFAPGDKVKIHVGDGALRSYTPASVDAAAGVMSLVLHAHGDSPGSAWARGLAAGDAIHFLGPASSMTGPGPEVRWAAFYGDETAIGLAEAIAAALPSGVRLRGAIEVAAEDAASVAHLGADTELEPVQRAETHGPALRAHLERLEVPAGGRVFLSGEAGSVLALRAALLERGVPRASLHIKPYWSLRGKAHRKELERTVLRT